MDSPGTVAYPEAWAVPGAPKEVADLGPGMAAGKRGRVAQAWPGPGLSRHAGRSGQPLQTPRRPAVCAHHRGKFWAKPLLIPAVNAGPPVPPRIRRLSALRWRAQYKHHAVDSDLSLPVLSAGLQPHRPHPTLFHAAPLLLGRLDSGASFCSSRPPASVPSDPPCARLTLCFWVLRFLLDP